MNEQDKLNLVTNYFAEDWAINKAMQLLDDYEKMVEAQQPAATLQHAVCCMERERICATIKAEDDYCVDHGDYMLDSDDCIKIVRGEWVRPDFAVDADRK